MQTIRILGILVLSLSTAYSFSRGPRPPAREGARSVRTQQAETVRNITNQRMSLDGSSAVRSGNEVRRNSAGTNELMERFNNSRSEAQVNGRSVEAVQNHASYEGLILEKFTKNAVPVEGWSAEAVANLNQFQALVGSSLGAGANPVVAVNTALVEFGISDVKDLNQVKEDLTTCRM